MVTWEMGIDTIKGIGPATRDKLDKAGVRTLADMRDMDTQQVAKRTGIPKRRLDEWRLEARMLKVLDDVKGIGPATKRRLEQAGIRSLDDLAKASIKEIAHQARVAQDRARKWQTDARRLAQQGQKRITQERDALQQRGSKTIKKAGKRARKAVRRGKQALKTARTQTTTAAERGRRAADEIIEGLRHRNETGTPVTAQRETPATQAPGAGKPGTHGTPSAPGTPGTNGHDTGILGRLRRLLKRE